MKRQSINKVIYTITSLTVVVCLSIPITAKSYEKISIIQEENRNYKILKPSPEGQRSFNFIINKLSREDGAIYTTYIDPKSKYDSKIDQCILSESEGLMLLYSLDINDKALFDKHFNIIQNHMTLSNGLISWSVTPNNTKNASSALIDDLRIFKAFTLGYDYFSDYKYKVAANNLARSIVISSTSNNIPVDCNDSVNKSNILPLRYIDLESLKLLAKANINCDKLINNSKTLLNNGLISTHIPFFREQYTLNTNSYSTEKESDLLFSLICWENKLNNGDDVTPMLSWIKNTLNTYGALYNKYDNTTGKHTGIIESTSIYAIASRLAYKSGDIELYNKLCPLLLRLQVNDTSSEIYGSFGFAPRKEAHSFDNLQGLLSLLRYVH